MSAPPRARFCTNCGTPLTPEHRYCGNCGVQIGVPLAAVPYTGSSARPAVAPVELTRLRRLAALSIDAGLVVAAFFAVFFVLGFVGTLAGKSKHELNSWSGYAVVAWLAIVFCYPIVCEPWLGGTLGKVWVGLCTRTESGDRVSVGRAVGHQFARTLSIVLLMLGYLPFPFNHRRQTMHDMMAGLVPAPRNAVQGVFPRHALEGHPPYAPGSHRSF
jgi:uncharacterized RDD family membrane protein YckC